MEASNQQSSSDAVADQAFTSARNQRGGEITGMDIMCGYSDDCAGRVIVEEDNKSNDDGVHGSGSNSHDGQKILESENLDRRETDIEDLCVVLSIFSIARQYKFDSESDDDDAAVTFSGGNIVHVWDGWDAALIVSKRGNVKQGVTLDSYDEKVQEEDGSREMTLNECKKQHLGKRKVRENRRLEEETHVVKSTCKLVYGLRQLETENAMEK